MNRVASGVTSHCGNTHIVKTGEGRRARMQGAVRWQGGLSKRHGSGGSGTLLVPDSPDEAHPFFPPRCRSDGETGLQDRPEALLT
jgi:hypothetical protein